MRVKMSMAVIGYTNTMNAKLNVRQNVMTMSSFSLRVNILELLLYLYCKNIVASDRI